MSQQQAHYSPIFAAVSREVLWATDRDLMFSYVSDTVENMLGISPKRLLGRSLLSLVPGEKAEAVKKRWLLDLEIAEKDPNAAWEMQSLELPWLHADGQTLWTHSKTALLRDDHQHVMGLAGSTLDFSNEHRLLDKFAFARDRAVSNNRTSRAYHARLQHELRTPLSAISVAAEIIERQDEKALDASVFSKLQRAVAELNEKIAFLLDTSSGADTSEEGMQLFSLRDLLASLESYYRQACEARGMQLQVDFEQERLAPMYYGDLHRLRRIVALLFEHAFLKTVSGTVNLQLSHSNESLCANITWPENQTPPDIRTAAQSLALTRELTSELGGGFVLDEKELRSNHLKVYLPLTASQKPELDPMATGQFEVLRGRLLMVDDHQEILDLLKLLLSQDLLQIDTARNGQEACERFMRNNYQAVLMDINMPVMDGIEASRRIRSWEKSQGREACPLIALTALNSSRDKQRMRDAGFSGILTKPVTLDELRSQLKPYLRGGVVKVSAQRRLSKASVQAQLTEVNRGNVAAAEQVFIDTAPSEVIKAIDDSEENQLYASVEVQSALAEGEAEAKQQPVPAAVDATTDKSAAVSVTDNGKERVEIDASLKVLIPHFMENRQKDVEAIRRCIETEDRQALRRYGHTLKGSAASYGFNTLSEIGKQLQEAAESGEPEAWKALLTAYLAHLENIEIVYV